MYVCMCVSLQWYVALILFNDDNDKEQQTNNWFFF